MNIKHKIAAALAASALALGVGLAAAPAANACYGNSVLNLSNGLITVQYDSGTKGYLYGFGTKTKNVGWVLVPQYGTISVGTKRYSAGWQAYWMSLGCGQYTINRIS